MVLPQEARRADEVLLVENTIGHGILTSGERLAGDVREDLAADLVDAEDARRLEPDALQVPEERVDRGRPRARATPHGVADTDSLVEIATEGDFLRHAPKAKPRRCLLGPGLLSRGDRAELGAGGRDQVCAGVRVTVHSPAAFGRLGEENPRAPRRPRC